MLGNLRIWFLDRCHRRVLKTMLTNDQIHKNLSEHIIKNYFPNSDNVEVGPWEVNCFSICFWINAIFKSEQKGIYVKIPKVIFYNKQNESIMPLSDKDKILAEDEYRSLIHLGGNWPTNETHFIKVLDFVKEYNAIITERFYGNHFFKILKKCDLKRRVLSSPRFSSNILKRLAQSLSKFHQLSMKPCKVDLDKYFFKIEKYSSELKSLGVSKDYLDNLFSRLNKANSWELDSYQTTTLKGLDIRQVFINGQSDIFILDPGRMKNDYLEADLARFITTCKILYWGTFFIFLNLSPGNYYTDSFIKGYSVNNKISTRLINILIIKELLKFWRMAYLVTGVRSWSLPIKKTLQKIYIDPFYKGQINSELTTLGL
tara:strand:- start:1123 stop:2238 length:1116 start_codon:yes stop_codon:yes gene_type:complete